MDLCINTTQEVHDLMDVERRRRVGVLVASCGEASMQRDASSPVRATVCVAGGRRVINSSCNVCVWYGCQWTGWRQCGLMLFTWSRAAAVGCSWLPQPQPSVDERARDIECVDWQSSVRNRIIHTSTCSHQHAAQVWSIIVCSTCVARIFTARPHCSQCRALY